MNRIDGMGGGGIVDAEVEQGLKLFVAGLIILFPVVAVFVVVLIAVFWPSRFSLRGLLICVTWLALALGIAVALYRLPE